MLVHNEPPDLLEEGICLAEEKEICLYWGSVLLNMTELCNYW